MKFVKLAVAASVVAFAGTAGAATDGTLGGTSTGSADVIIVKDEAVQISDVDDFDFNAAGGGVLSSLATDPTVTDAVCVFSSTAGYDIDITSANGFVLVGAPPAGGGAAPASTIEYDVSWGADDVETTAAISGTGNTTTPDCGGTGTGVGYTDVTVTLSSADFNAAEPGSYADTLTMVVSPQ